MINGLTNVEAACQRPGTRVGRPRVDPEAGVVSAHSWGKLSFASSYEPVGGFGAGPYTRYTTPVLNGCEI